ncbi:MAG: hypothetical protein ACW97V_19535 [Promethearchaeota archaeon]
MSILTIGGVIIVIFFNSGPKYYAIFTLFGIITLVYGLYTINFIALGFLFSWPQPQLPGGYFIILLIIPIIVFFLMLIGSIIGYVRTKYPKFSTLKENGTERSENLLSSGQRSETTYLVRIEREKTISGEEISNYICGKCKSKNSLKEINRTLKKYQCLDCGASNYLKQ